LVEEILAATQSVCPIEFSAGRLPARAAGDTALVRHIFTNLLSNAVKYSSPGSAVQFAVERDGRDAVFRVADHGIGIPEADLKQLFESFHRGGNVGEIPGTGLGMVLVKRCVELHRGDIAVESVEGRGTTVTVRLPLFEK
jgi:signal transduction histidine kinase